MFNFDEPRYEKVVSDALALRPQIEAAVDKVCEQGYSNIFFIGCGGTFSTITSPAQLAHAPDGVNDNRDAARVHERYVSEIQHADHRKIKIDLVADDAHRLLRAVMIDIAL